MFHRELIGLRNGACMRVRPVPIALAVLAAAGVALMAARAPAAPTEPAVEVVLEDTGLTVNELVEVVRHAAVGVPGSDPDRDLRIIFTPEIPNREGRPLVAGQQQDSTVWVRVDGVAMHTRTLLHELAHVVAPDADHGDTFRAIYLAAIEDVYDESTRSREARRLAWVYDRCYLDDACPKIRRADDEGGPAVP